MLILLLFISYLDVPSYKNLKNKNNSYRNALNLDIEPILEQIHASTPHTFQAFSLSKNRKTLYLVPGNI